MNKVLGVVMVLMALTLAVAPIFSDCQSQGRALTLADGRTAPMKCHWAGVAAIGAAVPLGLAGLAALRRGRRETTRTLGVLGTVSGVMGILFPTLLIGVCANPSMMCNMVMRPVLIAASLIGIVASVLLFVAAREPSFNVAGAAA